MSKAAWDKSKFIKRIRVSEDSMEFIKSTRRKKSLAGRLEEIISKHKREAEKKETYRQDLNVGKNYKIRPRA